MGGAGGSRARSDRRALPEAGSRRDRKTYPQELQVALQVAEGKANRDAAAALFLSPKTVEFHLTRVYRKLNVRTRAELARLLASEERRERVIAEGRAYVFAPQEGPVESESTES